MYELKKKLERYLRVNLLGPDPRLLKKKEFTVPRSHKVSETPDCTILFSRKLAPECTSKILNSRLTPFYFEYHEEVDPYLYFSIHRLTTVLIYKQEIFNFRKATNNNWGTRWGNWLRHCATSRKVAGSIPNGVIGIFH